MLQCGFVRANFALAMDLALSSATPAPATPAPFPAPPPLRPWGRGADNLPQPTARLLTSRPSARRSTPTGMERVRGIEPPSSAWKAAALPLSYTRKPRTKKGQERYAPKPRRYSAPGADRVLIYGWHSVKAALENPRRRIRKLILTENALRRLSESGISLPIEPDVVPPEEFSAHVPADAVH